jgi:hypothetical protein
MENDINKGRNNAPHPSMQPHDRNRGVHQTVQYVDKVFQEYWGAQQNPPIYATGYSYEMPAAPFGNEYKRGI